MSRVTPRCAKGQGERGQSTVEFALVALAFVLLVFALLELGRWAYLANAVTLVAQEAARFAAGEPALSDAEVKDLALSRAVGLDPDRLELVIVWANDPRRVEVVARYPYEPVVSLGVFSATVIERRASLAY